MDKIEQYNGIKITIKSLNDEICKLQSNTAKLETTIFDLGKAKDILTLLKNTKMEKKKDFILHVINSALGEVFDQDIIIDIQSSLVGSSLKYDIVLFQNDIEIARNEKLLTNNGGGVLSFISILFKILIGYIYSDNRFFLFDESISQVSPTYRPKLAKFIQGFCKEYGFTICLVSQTDDIDEFADIRYILSSEILQDNSFALKIENKIVNTKLDDYYYTRVKNFQSIVDLTFEYKGFTVIRGDNNIGKSATFRAINALLFNTFDAKSYPRKGAKRGNYPYIEFGHVTSVLDNGDKISDFISLEYKANKVHYTFDDKTYSGKSLAFEKIKEKAEKLGFKYMSIKDAYKNFKGNLKDQTDRLAMTTQHDSFFLVGNKSNDSSKIFDFLFDSSHIATAITLINNDITAYSNEFDKCMERLNIASIELNTANKQYNVLINEIGLLYIELYSKKIKAIEDKECVKKYQKDVLLGINGLISIIAFNISYESIKNKIEILNNTNSLLSNKKMNLETVISNKMWLDYITSYESIKNKIEILNNTNSLLSNKKINLETIISNKMWLDYITSYESIKNKIEILNNTNSLLSNKKINLETIISNKMWLDYITSYESIKNKIEILNNTNLELNNKKIDLIHLHGIEECPHCGGSGYINK